MDSYSVYIYRFYFYVSSMCSSIYDIHIRILARRLIDSHYKQWRVSV